MEWVRHLNGSGDICVCLMRPATDVVEMHDRQRPACSTCFRSHVVCQNVSIFKVKLIGSGVATTFELRRDLMPVAFWGRDCDVCGTFRERAADHRGTARSIDEEHPRTPSARVARRNARYCQLDLRSGERDNRSFFRPFPRTRLYARARH
jgi:hypothetical protein